MFSAVQHLPPIVSVRDLFCTQVNFSPQFSVAKLALVANEMTDSKSVDLIKF